MWSKLYTPLLLLSPSLVLAQFPSQPNYDQEVAGKLGDGYRVSLKQNSVCETTPGVKSYSGYITTPPSNASLIGANSFFWFFESRKDPENAPLVIFLGGGPGYNSISSAVGDLGPCWANADSNSTTLNEWSFNNEANLLFVDQPNMVGFSYDSQVNGSINFDNVQPGGLGVALTITPETKAPLPEPNVTLALGTFPSQNISNTAQSADDAAEIFWQSFQTWSTAFPQYIPEDHKLSLWTESYGGRYGPEFTSLFYSKNKQIAAGQLCEATQFEFDTLGLINAWLDPVLHMLSYPAFAVNNTYGVQMVNTTILAAMQQSLTSPGGCLDLVSACQTAAQASDPQDTAQNSTVDGICAEALSQCATGVQEVPIAVSGLTTDDITQSSPGSWLNPYHVGFFAQAWVQQALGAAVNFTDNSEAIFDAFAASGDFVRNGQLEHVGQLLDAGVHVAIISGDRDYQINWFGGEPVSLATAWEGMDGFSAAGYANITTNDTYVGGLVRQSGRLSFSRVFQAGHQGPAYQPETYFRIFNRTIHHLDVADGMHSVDTAEDGSVFATQGPASTLSVREDPLPQKEPICYQLEASLACTPEQLEVVRSGQAVFKDFVLQS